MCARDDDPTQHDEPRPAGVFDRPTCPLCGHPWRAHMTRAAYDMARAFRTTPVPCIEPGKAGYLCGCVAITPRAHEWQPRPTAGHV